MERKKLIIGIMCLFFVWACNNTSEKKEKSKESEFVEEAKNDEKIIDEPTIVHWMYMDDSLRLLCKPLFYSLPWMESDIYELPEQITPELFSLSPLKNSENSIKWKGRITDSLFFYGYILTIEDCNCNVYRFYKGDPKSEKFNGFTITEQIICNANNYDLPQLKLDIQSENTPEIDTTVTYEVHGHDH